MAEVPRLFWRDQRTANIAGLACWTYGLQSGPFSSHLLAALLRDYPLVWRVNNRFQFHFNDLTFLSNYPAFGSRITKLQCGVTQRLLDLRLAEDWLRNHAHYFHAWRVTEPVLPRPVTETTLWYMAMRVDRQQPKGIKRLQTEPKSIPAGWWEQLRQQAWIVPNDWADPERFQSGPIKHRRQLY